MGYVNDAMKEHFKSTKEGRKLFFPWGPRVHGYIVPSEELYERLRRGQRLWVNWGAPSGVFTLFVIHYYVESVTGSFWKGFMTFCVVATLIAASHFVWVRFRCAGLAKTYERC